LKLKASIVVCVVVCIGALMGVVGCGGGSGGGGNPVAPGITVQPANRTVTVGLTATFSVTATGSAPLSYEWQKNNVDIAGAPNSPSYTTPATVLGDSGATFRVIVSNGTPPPATSSEATLTVNAAPPPSAANVLTYHNDNSRTGQNLNETQLTTTNVNSNTFGKLGSLAVTGLVDAEPLYVGGLTINGGMHNVVFVATEHDMVYAFDADTPGAALWSVSVLANGETSSDAVNGCTQVEPEIGITSTPVIDKTFGAHGAIFVVAMSKNGTTYHQRLHALDLTTGADLTAAADISATFANKTGTTTFDPKQYEERAGLLLLNSVVYLAWTSHCDDQPYTGWVMGYSESSLQQVSVVNVTPNGTEGGIWMSGDGLAADTSGNIYFLDGNGTFETTLVNGQPSNADYGNAFIKLSTTGNTLTVADYFNMFDTITQSQQDEDLGSGGAILLPDMADAGNVTRHLAVGAGKPDFNSGQNVIYVVDRDSMGGFHAGSDAGIYQEFTPGITGEIKSTPAYYNGAVYYGAVGDTLKAFKITKALLGTTPSSHSPSAFGYPGTTPSISANGTSNGIVWAIENGTTTGTLHAFDATNLASELYNSNQAAGGRDTFSTNSNCKFVAPMIANGKVYVGTPGAVVIFGLL
jgi:hypothetical protein